MLTIDMAILLPFLAAILILIFYKNHARFHVGWAVLSVPVILFILVSQHIPFIKNGQTLTNITAWIPSFDINFITYLDGLSMIFGLLITGIGALVILYSIYYVSTDEDIKHFYIYLLLFMGSMLGVVFSDHLMTLYVFWELTSISSFLLIAFWYQRKGSRYGAKKSLIITVLGGFSMLIGFLMLQNATGSFSIREIIANIDLVKNHPLLIPMIILILLGAFTKSAQFPFHIWLPDAMEAPTPISAYLHSATMVKAGIYLVARLSPVFGGEALWFWLISSIGLITLFWAAFNAIRQTDLKALLAYSTVSQLGLIMTLLGVGSLSLHKDMDMSASFYSLAVFAALFHLVNHSTFKGSLFMIIGIIDFQTGTRDLRRLGGLLAFMPISFTIALIGSFSMAGLPPFNGFLSKEMFFSAMLKVSEFNFFSVQTFAWLFPLVAWIASVFTFLYSMKLVFQSFFGSAELLDEEDLKEPKLGMLISPIILASLVVLIFFFPNVLGDYILQPAILSIYPNLTAEIPQIAIWHGFNTELYMTIGIILFGTILYIFNRHWEKIYIIFPKNLSYDQLYNNILHYMDRAAKSVTNFFMTGLLRDYLAYIFMTIVVLLGGALIKLDVLHLTMKNDKAMTTFEYMIALTIVVAAITIPLVKSRLSAIIVNGYIGFAIALFFVLFRAPDLALTQLVVETITTALFLLSFYFLPEWEKKRAPLNIRNLIIAILVGSVVTLIALAVNSGRLFTSISTYFEQADNLNGAKNIVNSILGDFRAFDTMLEVIVLFIAGIGVYALIKFSKREGTEKN